MFHIKCYATTAVLCCYLIQNSAAAWQHTLHAGISERGSVIKMQESSLVSQSAQYVFLIYMKTRVATSGCCFAEPVR
jgi:hypothetical protein